jgi:hypothetical protein
MHKFKRKVDNFVNRLWEGSRFLPFIKSADDHERSTFVSQEQRNINDSVVSKSREIFLLMNKNWRYPTSMDSFYTESPFWEVKRGSESVLENGGSKEISFPTLIYKGEPDHLISSLKDLVTKPAILECTIANSTAQIFCLLDLLGQEKFTQYFIKYCNILKEIPGMDGENYYHKLPLPFLTKLEGEPVLGSITYRKNINLYNQFKPQGNFKGDNFVFILMSLVSGSLRSGNSTHLKNLTNII